MKNVNGALTEESPRVAQRLIAEGKITDSRYGGVVEACPADLPSARRISTATSSLQVASMQPATKASAGAASSRFAGVSAPLHQDGAPRNSSWAAKVEKPVGSQANGDASGVPMHATSLELGRIPAAVSASATLERTEYDARRLRSQREVVRDVMLSAANCETWLTLGELRALTRYGEASISAQLRHLRKAENGGYEIAKRQREGARSQRPAAGGRGECVWEYLISQSLSVADAAEPNAERAAAGA